MAEVRLEIAESVAFITIDHMEVSNALTDEMVREFVDICGQIDRDERIGATVLRGAGGTFCSGADTRDWTGDVLSDDAFARVTAMYRLFMRVGNLQTPTIAAVRGAAVGAGLNLALATDLRIVAADARLIGGFARVGIHPGGGFFHLIGRSAGREVAAAVGVFGEECSGEEAVRRGIAWRAVDDGQVEDRASDLARKAARDPRLARQTVATLRAEIGPPGMGWESAQEMERGRQMWSIGRRAGARTD
jgi:enoyl-CoA hydratase